MPNISKLPNRIADIFTPYAALDRPVKSKVGNRIIDEVTGAVYTEKMKDRNTKGPIISGAVRGLASGIPALHRFQKASSETMETADIDHEGYFVTEGDERFLLNTDGHKIQENGFFVNDDGILVNEEGKKQTRNPLIQNFYYIDGVGTAGANLVLAVSDLFGPVGNVLALPAAATVRAILTAVPLAIEGAVALALAPLAALVAAVVLPILGIGKLVTNHRNDQAKSVKRDLLLYMAAAEGSRSAERRAALTKLALTDASNNLPKGDARRAEIAQLVAGYVEDGLINEEDVPENLRIRPTDENPPKDGSCSTEKSSGTRRKQVVVEDSEDETESVADIEENEEVGSMNADLTGTPPAPQAPADLTAQDHIIDELFLNDIPSRPGAIPFVNPRVQMPINELELGGLVANSLVVDQAVIGDQKVV